MSRSAALVLALLALAPACSRGPSPEGPATSAGPAANAPGGAANPLPKSGVVAVVNGAEISEAEYADALAASAFLALPATPEGRRKVLDSLVENALIVQDATVQKYLERPLVQRVVERFERQVLGSMSQQRILESVKPLTDEQIAREVGDPGDRLDLTVFLTDELADAEAALARVRAGEKFEAVAQEVSVAPGVGSSGAIRRRGLVRGAGMYTPEVEAAVFALAKGQISEPIRTEVGYLVVRVDERRPHSAEELAAMRAKARQGIEARRSDDAVEHEISTRREKARVEVLVEDIDRVRLPDPELDAATLWREIEEVRVARVDGLTLTLGDVVRDQKQYREMVSAVGQARNAAYRGGLEAALRTIMLARWGREHGVDSAPGLLAAKQGFVKTVLRAQYFNDLYLGVTDKDIDDAGCRAFFDKQGLGAKAPALVTLSHILVRRREDLDRVLSRVRSGGSFAALAREHSVATTGAAGGDLGPRFENELGDVLDKQGIDDLLGKVRSGNRGPIVIRTTAGYNVFQVRDFKEAGTAGYELLREKVRPKYLEYCRNEAIRGRVAALKEKAVVFVDDQKMREVKPAASGASGVAPHGAVGAGRAAAPQGMGAAPHGGMGASPHGGMPGHP